MASMPEKKIFRARVLDPNKRLPVRIRAKSRQQSPKVKRAAAIPPSGMEKEEEMESHLQQAIYAQKATSAGIHVKNHVNHVIPTPRVTSIDENEYHKTYKRRSYPTKKLIVFRDFVSFFLNQSAYDADSEDEEWLSSKENICISHFEEIIAKLEMASQTADSIIHPMEAKALLQRYDQQTIDDVYDYWLQKRKQAASKNSKYGSVLIPHLNTDGNIYRREEKTTVNPYIAFRKRMDKVQTRKKQKTEIQTYEKILRLNYALKRSMALIESVKLREKTKLILVDYNEEIFGHQYLIGDENNRELDRISAAFRPSFRIPDLPSPFQASYASNPVSPTPFLNASKKRPTLGPMVENGGKHSTISNSNKNKNFTSTFFQSKKRSRFNRSRVGIADEDSLNIASDVWLKRNVELWNRITPTVAQNFSMPSTAASTSNLNGSTGAYSLLDTHKLAQVDANSSVDGSYQFKRKAGCRYRAANELLGSCVERFPQAVSPSYLLNAWKTLAEADEDLKTDGQIPPYFKIKLGADTELFAINPALLSHKPRWDRFGKRIEAERNTVELDPKGNPTQKSVLSASLGFENVRFARRRFGRGGRVIFDLNF